MCVRVHVKNTNGANKSPKLHDQAATKNYLVSFEMKRIPSLPVVARRGVACLSLLRACVGCVEWAVGLYNPVWLLCRHVGQVQPDTVAGISGVRAMDLLPDSACLQLRVWGARAGPGRSNCRPLATYVYYLAQIRAIQRHGVPWVVDWIGCSVCDKYTR